MRDADEEARAALWRSNQVARRQFVGNRFLGIKAKSDAIEKQVMDDWEPVLMAIAENRVGGVEAQQPERGV
jgi:hypothetical protein